MSMRTTDPGSQSTFPRLTPERDRDALAWSVAMAIVIATCLVAVAGPILAAA